MDTLDKYIKVIDNVLSDELCEKLVAEFGENEWGAGVVQHGVDKRTRDVDTIGLSYDDVISLNRETRLSIDKEIFDGAQKAIGTYLDFYPDMSVSKDSGYALLRYKEGQFITQHVDNFTHMPRTLSCSFALNSNYEGGEFMFFDRSLTVRVPKGSAILFPSNFMYPHEILPIAKGVRYSIITWFL
jgi:predicted 2-oxoglutarate/Fe(II)-dependent dioxygenase YbiX